MEKPSFLSLARRRVVVLDGAMGSNLQTRPLDLQRDWLGHENISEVLNFSRPDVIQEIHEAFLAVGCDAVETNTFGANKIVMAEADMAERVFENNKVAAEIARRACDKFETPDRPRYVVGSIGPGTKLLTLGHTDWDDDARQLRRAGARAARRRGGCAADRDAAGPARDQVRHRRRQPRDERSRPARADHGAGVVRPRTTASRC